MNTAINKPEGATHILNDEVYLKWVNGVLHAFLNGVWVKAANGISLEEWKSKYTDQTKEV